ncbi:hypothetical protein JOB18_016489 [Solea senegalensis]|uniref:Uncharacterized protein n=1 Tax=Solea senegalensis TaxID=28829 RepID=A0AAV6RAP0_SOLSE|nr:hypothetical protein JOB18_016489 [Solea senegalensis]
MRYCNVLFGFEVIKRNAHLGFSNGGVFWKSSLVSWNQFSRYLKDRSLSFAATCVSRCRKNGGGMNSFLFLFCPEGVTTAAIVT